MRSFVVLLRVAERPFHQTDVEPQEQSLLQTACNDRQRKLRGSWSMFVWTSIYRLTMTSACMDQLYMYLEQRSMYFSRLYKSQQVCAQESLMWIIKISHLNCNDSKSSCTVTVKCCSRSCSSTPL